MKLHLINELVNKSDSRVRNDEIGDFEEDSVETRISGGDDEIKKGDTVNKSLDDDFVNKAEHINVSLFVLDSVNTDNSNVDSDDKIIVRNEICGHFLLCIRLLVV